LRSNVLIGFLSGNFLVFLSTHQQYHSLVLRKRIINNYKENIILGQFQSQLYCLGLKINKGFIQEASLMHSDSGYAKADKL
jgi:hypothetical protein